MNVCNICGYKVVSNKVFEKHLSSHVEPIVEEAPIKVEVVPEPVVEPVAEEPKEEGITIHFSKSIEVFINGIPYVGKDIKIKDMRVASEVVRIAREAYGPTILL